MRDRVGRELTYLRVSLIDRCNLRCLYCMPKGEEIRKNEHVLSRGSVINPGTIGFLESQPEARKTPLFWRQKK